MSDSFISMISRLIGLFPSTLQLAPSDQRHLTLAPKAPGLQERNTVTDTMAAYWHVGMIELGNAELTEHGVMSLSGHRTPEAARGYIDKTDTQRLSAARKRRAWVQEFEHPKNESQNALQ